MMGGLSSAASLLLFDLTCAPMWSINGLILDD